MEFGITNSIFFSSLDLVNILKALTINYSCLCSKKKKQTCSYRSTYLLMIRDVGLMYIDGCIIEIYRYFNSKRLSFIILDQNIVLSDNLKFSDLIKFI